MRSCRCGSRRPSTASRSAGIAEAALHWSRAVDLAEEYDDEQVAELALRALYAANYAGAGDRYLDLADRGKRAAVRHGQRQLLATLMAAAAGIHNLEISMERSVTEMQAAVDEFRGLPPSWEQVNALITLYWLQWGSGRPAEGIPHLRLAVQLEESLAKKSGRALATLAHAQLMDGEVEAGLAAMAEARQRLGTGADGDVRLAMAEIDTKLKLNRLEEAADAGLAIWNRLQANGLADDYVGVIAAEQGR